MSHKQFTSNRRTRTDLATELHPDIFEEGSPLRPKGSAREGGKDAGSSHQLAPWVPVAWQDTVSKNYFCLMTGKMVAMDIQGKLVPAGMKVLLDESDPDDDATTDFISYTATDVDAITMDITTGEAVEAAITYDIADVTTALIARGLIAPDQTLRDFIQPTVGAIIQTVFSPFSLGDATAAYKQKWTNFLLQKGLQFTTHHQMKVPVVPSTAGEFTAPGSLTGTALVFGSGHAFSADNAKLVARYAGVTATNFIAIAFEDRNIAKNTDRTPFECSNSAVLVRERTVDLGRYVTEQEAIAAALLMLTQTGDWLLDRAAGVLFLYENGGNAMVGASAGYDYSHYGASPTAVSRYMCVEGGILPGDYVKVTQDSNFTKWVSGDDDEALKVGRCYGLVTEPNGLLQHVRTPVGIQGSGTDGYTKNVTLTGAADTLAKIVMLCR